MFRTAELGRTVSKVDFEAIAVDLRTEMLDLQQRLRATDVPVILVFAGVDGAGKAASMNLINEWMDPRWIVTRAYKKPSDEERERPEYWRFWRDLPPKGKIGLFLSSWYSDPILEHVHATVGDLAFDRRLERIAQFEQTLADDGALILKFWMHMSKDAQKARLKKLEKKQLMAPSVLKTQWNNLKHYDSFIAAAEKTIMRTSTGNAPWMIVEGTDSRYRSLTVLTRLRDALRERIDQYEAGQKAKAAKKSTAATAKKEASKDAAEDALEQTTSVLDALVMGEPLDKKVYSDRLKKARARLAHLFVEARDRGITTALVFEGADAAGKGGSIRRMVSALDARDWQVIPIAAPTEEEFAQHYLWRFWRHLPRAGRLIVFDRSWYGRVLVERVEGFAREEEWRRAYAEINDFEAQLVEHGVVLVKYWIHITKDEQLRRFKLREETPFKSWKLTDEDWRNREKWDLYDEAVNDIVEQTSPHSAPWVLVEGNDKRFARIKVIETLCHHLEKALTAPGKSGKSKK
ncbi:polyphosphate--AMP phosphotransferase [Magnetospira thiophila]